MILPNASLGDAFALGRSNHFNLMRLLAAMAVVISHSFTLSTGNPQLEPMRSQVGFSLGTLAVDVFFIISGFLITSSAERSRNVWGFVKRRVLRIYPGLVVMVVLTTIILGMAFSTLDPLEFFSHPLTIRYVALCSTLMFGIAYQLPGVFEGNPYPVAVNGPLWTLPEELTMYAFLAALYFLLRHLKGGSSRLLRMVGLLILLVTLFRLLLAGYVAKAPTDYVRLPYMFAAGSMLYLFRAHMPHSVLAAILLSTFLAAAYVFKPYWFLLLSAVALPYCVISLAYASAKPLQQFNLLGDYSYGTYIYAFPIQQVIAQVVPGLSPLMMMVQSLLLTLVLAVASWHFVEKPALSVAHKPPG